MQAVVRRGNPAFARPQRPKFELWACYFDRLGPTGEERWGLILVTEVRSDLVATIQNFARLKEFVRDRHVEETGRYLPAERFEIIETEIRQV